MSPQRFELAKFTPTLYVDNLITFLSLKEKVNSNFKFLTIFEPITWWVLFILLMIYSVINLKKKTNLLIDLIISFINHFECLVTKQSKSILFIIMLIMLIMLIALIALIVLIVLIVFSLKSVHFHLIKLTTFHTFSGFLAVFLSQLCFVMTFYSN